MSLVSHNEILPEHFYSVPDREGVFLTREGRKIFLQAYERLVGEATGLIDRETDSLRIYLLGIHTAVRSWGVSEPHLEEVVIF